MKRSLKIALAAAIVLMAVAFLSPQKARAGWGVSFHGRHVGVHVHGHHAHRAYHHHNYRHYHPRSHYYYGGHGHYGHHYRHYGHRYYGGGHGCYW